MSRNYKEHTDQHLASLLKNKDHFAFMEVYSRYWSVLYLHAIRMLRNEDLSKDTVHDVFANLWEKADDFELTTNLNAYLYKSVKNSILNYIRHERISEKYLMELQHVQDNHIPSIEGTIHLKQLQELIEDEIQKLPPETKKVFEMSRKLHLSHAEIALKLGKSEQTVKNQIKRALKILRKELNLPLYLILFLI